MPDPTWPSPTAPLVSTDWLARHLDQVRVVDATWFMPGGPDPREHHRMARIPGAVFFDIDDIAEPNTDPLPHMIPTPERFAQKVGALGIDNRDCVIAYDAHGLMTAARAWWLFRLFGHDRVGVLDGGLPKWRREARALAAGEETPSTQTFNATFRPSLVRSADAVLANLRSGTEQIIDARTRERFAGIAPESWPGRAVGHIPGAHALPYGEFLDSEAKTILAPDTILSLTRAGGVDPDRPMVASCGSGVTACILALALATTGRTDVAVYDGSWAEWGLRPDLPKETGIGR